MNTKKENNVTYKIEVTRAHQFDNGDITFDMKVNEVSIYGCRLVNGKNGQFVSFPSRKGSDGNYYSYAHCKLSQEDTQSIIDQIEKM